MLLLLIGASTQFAQAGFGIYQDFAVLNSNNAGYAYFAGGANFFNLAPFQGKTFGPFSAGQTFMLGSEVKTFKNNGSNVTGGRLYYRVYVTGTAPGGFTQTNPAFSDNGIDGTDGNQKWTNVANTLGNNTPAPVDLLAGLATGSYTLEVYWTAQADNSADALDNNGGSYYQAIFDYDATPLPVTLTAFVAQRQGNDAVLSWTTANESNNAGFEVQVSPTGNSADFRVLSFVKPASAESKETREYTFRDAETGKIGVRYYRLHQLDTDGSATYSPVRLVAFDAATAVAFSVAPNPFRSSLTLSLALPPASAGLATLTLSDALGRTVRTQALGQLAAGASQPTLPALDDLPAGLYVLRLALPSGIQTAKLLKQ